LTDCAGTASAANGCGPRERPPKALRPVPHGLVGGASAANGCGPRERPRKALRPVPHGLVGGASAANGYGPHDRQRGQSRSPPNLLPQKNAATQSRSGACRSWLRGHLRRRNNASMMARTSSTRTHHASCSGIAGGAVRVVPQRVHLLPAEHDGSRVAGADAGAAAGGARGAAAAERRGATGARAAGVAAGAVATAAGGAAAAASAKRRVW